MQTANDNAAPDTASGATPRAAIIYVLCDPETKQIRYIGKTIRYPSVRLYEHCKDAITRRQTCHSARWIRSLVTRNLKPSIHILESLDGACDWEAAEQRWIAVYRSVGVPLTNITAGGEGHNGHSPDAAARKRMSDAARARGISPETRKKMQAAAAKVFATPEHREKLSRALSGPNHRMFGKRHSAETRAKMSATLRANPTLGWAHKGAANSNARAVLVNDVRYGSISEAAEALGMKPGTLAMRLARGTQPYASYIRYAA